MRPRPARHKTIASNRLAVGVGCLLLALLPFGPAVAQEIEAPPPAADVDVETLELELERAREQLDAAAERLAELNMRLYEHDARGERSGKPMLGVLIPDSKQVDGIKLIGVTPKGGAAEAGLKAGDRLLAVNGFRLDAGDNATHALRDAMRGVTAGDTVAVEYDRDGVVHMADITTQARGAYVMKMDFGKGKDHKFVELAELEALKELESLKELEALEDLDIDLEGIEQLAKLEALKSLADDVAQMHDGDVLELRAVQGDLADYFGVDAGVVAMAVPEGGDLKAGDVLLSLDGTDVADVNGAVDLLAHADADVEAVVLRDGRRRSVSIDPGTVAYSASGLGSGKRVKAIRIEVNADEEP